MATNPATIPALESPASACEADDTKTTVDRVLSDPRGSKCMTRRSGQNGTVERRFRRGQWVWRSRWLDDVPGQEERSKPLRSGELRRLRAGDVDLEKAIIHVRRSV